MLARTLISTLTLSLIEYGTQLNILFTDTYVSVDTWMDCLTDALSSVILAPLPYCPVKYTDSYLDTVPYNEWIIGTGNFAGTDTDTGNDTFIYAYITIYIYTHFLSYIDECIFTHSHTWTINDSCTNTYTLLLNYTFTNTRCSRIQMLTLTVTCTLNSDWHNNEHFLGLEISHILTHTQTSTVSFSRTV